MRCRGAPGQAKKMQDPLKRESCITEKIPATCYSPTTYRRSTIAAEALHFRVRYGNGCYRLAMATGKNKNIEMGIGLMPWYCHKKRSSHTAD